MTHAQTCFDPASHPHLVYAGTLDFKTGDAFYKPVHHHPEWGEILLITEGEGRYTIDGRQYEVTPRSVVVYNPGVWHEETSRDGLPHRMLYVAFSQVKVAGLPPGMFIAPDAPAVTTLHSQFFKVVERFRDVLQEYERGGPEAQVVSDHLLAVLLAEIARELHHPPTPRPSAGAQVVSGVKRYIQEHYAEDIRLEQLAAYFYLSPYYLSRTFSGEAGMGPMQYLRAYRLEVAKRMLVTTSDTVRKIAWSVGYHSETHFETLFRRHIGVTPRQFRKGGQG